MDSSCDFLCNVDSCNVLLQRLKLRTKDSCFSINRSDDGRYVSNTDCIDGDTETHPNEGKDVLFQESNADVPETDSGNCLH